MVIIHEQLISSFIQAIKNAAINNSYYQKKLKKFKIKSNKKNDSPHFVN